MARANDDTPVEIFRTANPALLPLALATLEQAAIEYAVQSANEGSLIMYGPRAGLGDVEGTAVVLVPAEDAARARDLLSGLEHPDESGAGVHAAIDPSPAARPSAPKPADTGPATVQLTDLDSGAPVGRITNAQLQFLIDQLEAESSDDQDYYIDAATIELLETSGADASLLAVLRKAVSGRDGVEIAWKR